MGFLSLFLVALMPVLKIILLTGVGVFLALDRIQLLGPEANHHLNNIVFYVAFPALTASSLAESITFKSFIALWFMPVNVLLTYIIGSILAWILIKITKTPKHLQGIVIGCCSAGNIGNLILIILPAVCKEPRNPFGDRPRCSANAMIYASLSLSLSAIYSWSYVYGIMYLYAKKGIQNENGPISGSETVAENSTELTAVPSNDQTHSIDIDPINSNEARTKISVLDIILQWWKIISKKVDPTKVFPPTAIAAVVGFIVGLVSPIRKLLIGNSAPLRVIDSSTYILGRAAIPCMALIMGANLLRGLRGSTVNKVVIIGVLIVRNVMLPLVGIGIVRAAKHFGVVGSEFLYHFVLMLQYAVPPAMTIGTMTEYFQIGQGETSVIMLWTYAVATLTLTLWSTCFMWILT